jgi:hypothetical protein
MEDNPQEGEQYEVTVHHALATRATFTVGRDDAARRALSVWCYEEAHHLTNTVWGDFPRRPARAVGSMIPVANANLGPHYAVQVGLSQLSTPTLMTPTWSCKTFVISKMRIRGKSKGLRQ